MGAVTSAAIAIAGVILGWITLEIACKPCLERGREALDRELNPDYDPDDAVSEIRSPLIPPAVEAFEPKTEIKDSAAGSATIKLMKPSLKQGIVDSMKNMCEDVEEENHLNGVD